MEKALTYQDVYLEPRYSVLESRSQADTGVDFLGFKFKLPVIPANMSSVIDMKTAKWLADNGYFYIMHRFDDNLATIQKMNEESWPLKSISVGVKDSDKRLIFAIAARNLLVDFITIDIAHGHSVLMRDMIVFIRNNLHHSVRIIAGNVATPEAVKDLTKWGADCAKVGIGPSSVCTTKNMTGFHVPMFSCVRNCFKMGDSIYYGGGKEASYSKVPIIADGGIRENGDIAKALVAGAKMVMIGGMFAACIDAPGETVCYCENNDWKTYKKFHGSASAKQKGENRNVEGIERQIPCNGMTYAEKYQEITESLQSSISYAGGLNLESFKNVKFITI